MRAIKLPSSRHATACECVPEPCVAVRCSPATREHHMLHHCVNSRVSCGRHRRGVTAARLQTNPTRFLCVSCIAARSTDLLLDDINCGYRYTPIKKSDAILQERSWTLGNQLQTKHLFWGVLYLFWV